MLWAGRLTLAPSGTGARVTQRFVFNRWHTIDGTVSERARNSAYDRDRHGTMAIVKDFVTFGPT